MEPEPVGAFTRANHDAALASLATSPRRHVATIDETRIISTRLIYPEARAALAQAERMRRLTTTELAHAVEDLDSIASEISYLEITAELAASAGDLAQAHGLRGYDAVHLAAAALVNDEELVFVTGDRELDVAARTIGIAVALTAP